MLILTDVLIKFNVKIDFITPVKINLRSDISEPREERNVMSDLGRDHVEGDEERDEKMSNILCRRQLAIDS